jgi:hypothetical protein
VGTYDAAVVTKDAVAKVRVSKKDEDEAVQEAAKEVS